MCLFEKSIVLEFTKTLQIIVKYIENDMKQLRLFLLTTTCLIALDLFGSDYQVSNSKKAWSVARCRARDGKQSLEIPTDQEVAQMLKVKSSQLTKRFVEYHRNRKTNLLDINRRNLAGIMGNGATVTDDQINNYYKNSKDDKNYGKFLQEYRHRGNILRDLFTLRQWIGERKTELQDTAVVAYSIQGKKPQAKSSVRVGSGEANQLEEKAQINQQSKAIMQQLQHRNETRVSNPSSQSSNGNETRVSNPSPQFHRGLRYAFCGQFAKN